MLKIGLFGVGHLGEIHLKCIKNIAELSLVGFYDPDEEKSKKIANQYKVKQFSNPATLMDAVDVVDIVSPTITHFQLANLALEKNKHLFIEKPVTHTEAEAAALLAKERKGNVKVQIGHVERFNPAFLTLKDTKLSPMFIEGHRLATFNPRGTDVSVILDLMIHDIDIVLSLVDSPVKQISASGVAVVSNTLDIANARIEFMNGCVANLTASRISLKKMRKLRFFQKDAYISLDFLDKQAQIVRLYDKDAVDMSADVPVFELETNQGTKLIHVEIPDIVPINAIQSELEALVLAIEKDEPTRVSLHDGYNAVKIAYQIMADIEKRKMVSGEQV
jgi:Predicted dehydrogenases and related proteins